MGLFQEWARCPEREIKMRASLAQGPGQRKRHFACSVERADGQHDRARVRPTRSASPEIASGKHDSWPWSVGAWAATETAIECGNRTKVICDRRGTEQAAVPIRWAYMNLAIRPPPSARREVRVGHSRRCGQVPSCSPWPVQESSTYWAHIAPARDLDAWSDAIVIRKREQSTSVRVLLARGSSRSNRCRVHR